MLLELLRSLFVRRCPSVIDLGAAGWSPVRCDLARGHGHQHWADRGMDEIRWSDHLGWEGKQAA